MRPDVRAPILAAIACAAGFLGVLALAYGGGVAAHADAVALHGFTTLDSDSVDKVIAPIAYSVNLVPMLVVLAVMALIGLAADRWRQVVAAVVIVAAADLSSQILKAALAHPRFDAALGGDQLNAAALPSGHATSVMALAVAALLISPRRYRPTVAAIGAAYALAVILSILILGWHFPSDVFAGMLLATGFGCLAVAVLKATDPERSAVQDPGALERSRFYGHEPDRGRAGGALEEWAAGALVLALAGALGVGIMISRAGALVDYARAETVSAAMAMIVIAICGSLLAGFAALARD